MKNLENKQIFSNNLKHYLNKFGINRTKLCDDLGLKYMTVSDWINAKTYPRIDKIEILADYFNIEKSDLIEPPKKDEVTFVGRANVMRTYRYIESKVSAGTPIAIDGQNYSSLAVPDSILGKYAKEDILFMHISGDSMNKIIPNGSLIGILEYNGVHDIKNGDIVVFNYNGNYSVKRFYKDEEQNRIIFKPESTDPTYLDIVYDLESENVGIIGKVIMYNVTLD